MTSVGQELKRERELRGISLQEIADTTKINIRSLLALEDDQFDALPGSFFIKGIIREYAKYLGLEESNTLNKYYEFVQSIEQEEEVNKTEDSGFPKKITNIIRIAAFGTFLIAVLICLFLIFGKNEPPPPQKAEHQKPAPEKIVAMPSILEEEKKEKKKAEELHVEFLFHHDTWIQIFADGEKVYSGIRLSGGRFEATAQKELLIDLGNAGGLSYTINGLKGVPFGQSGDVKKGIQITIDNYEEFLENSGNIDENQSDREIQPESDGRFGEDFR